MTGDSGMSDHWSNARARLHANKDSNLQMVGRDNQCSRGFQSVASVDRQSARSAGLIAFMWTSGHASNYEESTFRSA